MSRGLLILYKSKTGFTRRYAKLIAAETGGTALDVKKADPAILSSFDKVVFGSRMQAGQIDGLKDVQKWCQKSGVRLSALFVTGAMPDTETQTIAEIWKNHLTAGELCSLPHFYMQSGLCYEKMGFFDRTMIRIFVFMMKHKKEKSPDENRFAEMISHSYDISSKASIWPLVECLRKQSKEMNS